MRGSVTRFCACSALISSPMLYEHSGSSTYFAVLGFHVYFILYFTSQSTSRDKSELDNFLMKLGVFFCLLARNCGQHEARLRML